MSSSEQSISRSSKKMSQTGQSSHSDDSDSSRPNTRQDSWEVVEGLRGILGNAQVPDAHEGFLLKRRKWPMKGWHKRYFLLDKGILKYGKNGPDLQKGKCRGCIDVGLSVMSIKKKAMCIDLDTEDSIYHLKVKSRELFDDWVSKLRNHRVFRQNEIAMDPSERHLQSDPSSSMRNLILTKQASLQAMTGLLQNNDDLERCSQDLTECESCLLELNLLLKNMQVMTHAYSAPAINMLPGDGSKKEKRGPKKWRSKTPSKDSNNTLQVPSPTRHHVSNPNLSDSEPAYPETFLQTPDSPTNAARLQEDFCRLASTIHSTLLSAFKTLSAERTQIKLVLEQKNTEDALGGISSPLKHQRSNESQGSLSDSLSEFFDAREYLLSASSTDNEVSDDDSVLSDASDSVSVDYYNSEAGSERDERDSASVCVTRRSRLPCRSSDSCVSLWNILRNNIGKDLSKVSMPVHLNEPINTLQRLSEETEYTQLLDTAALTTDPHLRMVYVAVFAISAYASTFHRAGGKPFNPLLGETYESDRPDKGFRFISEQVSHHPPVSASHCESKNFILWQDVRWKNKFWGKSMEIVPMGTTHVVLPGFGDHYEWNKVTSCIHNILSGQRWIEHYGEMSIKNTVTNSNPGNCKVTFVKGRAGTSNVNDVEGVVTDADGHVIHSFFGKWNEAVYLGDPPSATCIWRANPMPEDFEQFYGLTQFAIELNELDEKERPLLPPTDTRFRPDQRLLEEGDVDGAEEQKDRIEGLQRERRRVLQENNISHQPRFFKRSEDDSWVSNGTYWDLRKDPGFKQLEFPLLW